MKAILCILLALAVGNEASILSKITLEPGLTVTFGVGEGYFMSLPNNTAEAKKQNFTETALPSSMPDKYKGLSMYCTPLLPTICIYFDPCTDYIAGMQIAIVDKNFTTPFNLTTNGYFSWKCTAFGVEEDCSAIKLMFISDEYLAKSCAERSSSYDNTTVIQGDAVYADSNNGAVLKIPTNGTLVREEGKFKQQSCIYWMGLHFFDFTESVDTCTAETFCSWFTLLHGDNTDVQTTHGVGMVLPGTYPAITGVKDYFERPGLMAIKAIVSDRPSCLDDLAEDNGVLTMHVYFCNNPQMIFC